MPSRSGGGVVSPPHPPITPNKEENTMEEQKIQAVAIQQIRDQIIRLEGRPPVMLAKDLAEIYQVTSRQITQAVRRNPDRFPEDFVFQLTEEEVSGLQNETRLSRQVTEKPLAFGL